MTHRGKEHRPFCAEPECGRPTVARGLCHRCYNRLRYRGKAALPPTSPSVEPDWLAQIRDRLGTVQDRVLAVEAGVCRSSVSKWRKRLSIPDHPRRIWPTSTCQNPLCNQVFQVTKRQGWRPEGGLPKFCSRVCFLASMPNGMLITSKEKEKARAKKSRVNNAEAIKRGKRTWEGKNRARINAQRLATYKNTERRRNTARRRYATRAYGPEWAEAFLAVLELENYLKEKEANAEA